MTTADDDISPRLVVPVRLCPYLGKRNKYVTTYILTILQMKKLAVALDHLSAWEYVRTLAILHR